MADNPITKKPINRNVYVGAGVVVGGLLYLWYRRRAAAASGGAQPGLIGATLPGTMPEGAMSNTTSVTPIGGSPVSLQEWFAKVQLWGNSLGYDPATIQNALQSYGLGNCLTETEYNILNTALGTFGMPPEAPYQGLAKCQPFQPPATDGGTDPLRASSFLRLLSPSGQHFWTTSQNEANSLSQQGWKVEGPAANLEASQTATNTPFLRLLSPTGEHFWTAFADEAQSLANQGWKIEGPAGYINTTAGSGQVPLLRLLSPSGEHFWTTSQNEAQSLSSQGWKVEGAAGYVAA